MALIRIPIALSPTGISETRRVKAQNLTHCWWPAIHDLKWGLPSRPIYRTVISEFRLGYRQIPQYWVVVFSPARLLNPFPKQRFTTSVWPSVCGWYALRNSSIVPNFFHQVIRAKNWPVRRHSLCHATWQPLKKLVCNVNSIGSLLTKNNVSHFRKPIYYHK